MLRIVYFSPHHSCSVGQLCLQFIFIVQIHVNLVQLLASVRQELNHLRVIEVDVEVLRYLGPLQGIEHRQGDKEWLYLRKAG